MSRYNNVYLPIVGFVKRNTDKAILLVVTYPEALTEEDAELELWIPKSQIAGQTPMRDQQGNTEVMMTEWIIGQKGIKHLVRAKTAVAKQAHPPVPTTPPVKSFVYMDDDIPF